MTTAIATNDIFCMHYAQVMLPNSRAREYKERKIIINAIRRPKQNECKVVIDGDENEKNSPVQKRQLLRKQAFRGNA